MAVVVPIVSEWNPKGVDRAMADIKRAEGKMGKLKAGLNKAFLPAAAALAGLGAAAWDASKAAEELTSSQAALSQVLSSMGYAESTDRLTALADEMERTLGVDEKLILQVQTTLGTFSELAASADQVGGAFDRTTMAALDLAAAGFGTAESNAIQLGKALNDPVTGLTALTRSGVTFTEVEKDKIKTLVESGKQLEAQEMILESLEKQVGGTAAATADSSAKMSLAFADVKESIGLALLPAFDALNEQLQGFARWAQENTKVILAVGGVIAGLAGAIVTLRVAMAVATTVTWAYNAAVVALGVSAQTTTTRLAFLGKATVAVTALLGGFALVSSNVKSQIDKVEDATDSWSKQLQLLAAGNNSGFLGLAAMGVLNLKRGLEKLTGGTSDQEAAQREATSATVTAAIEQGKLAGAADTTAAKINELNAEVAESARQAYLAAGSYISLWEAIAGAQRAERDFANTSGTVSSAIAEGVIAGPSPAFRKKVEDRYGDLAKTAGSGAAKTGKAIEKETKKYAKKVDATIRKTERGWELVIKNLDKLPPKMQRKLQKALDEHNKYLEEQMELAQEYLAEAEAAYSSFADSVRTALAPSLGSAWEAAKAVWEEGGKKGAIDYIAAFEAQIAERQWFSNVLRYLTANQASPQLIQALIAMGPTEGGALGQAIIDDGAIPKMNELLGQGDAIAESTSIALADEFFGTGVAMGNSLVDAIKAQALSRVEELRQLGRQLGDAVAGSASPRVASVPVSANARSSSSVVNVNVTAGIGDPVKIAGEIERVMRARDRRIGTR